jgi:hypothetical protein
MKIEVNLHRVMGLYANINPLRLETGKLTRVKSDGSSLYQVGNIIIEASVSPPCALCLCGERP